MDCLQADDLLIPYLDHDIPPDLKDDLEGHLSHCPQCEARLQYAYQERGALRFNGDIPALGEDFSERIMTAVRHTLPSAQPTAARSRMIPLQRFALTSAGLAAAVLILWVAWPHTLPDGANKPSIYTSTSQKEISDDQAMISMVESTADDNSGSDTTIDDQAEERQVVPEQVIDESAAGADQAIIEEDEPASEMVGEKLLEMTSIDSNPKVAVESPTDYPWHPGYLPDGFYLVQADEDNRGVSRLLFQDGQGGFISLIIKADQALSPTSDIQANDGDVPAVQSLTAIPGSPSPSVLDLDRVEDGNIFNLRLTSNLSLEELERIADSIE